MYVVTPVNYYQVSKINLVFYFLYYLEMRAE